MKALLLVAMVLLACANKSNAQHVGRGEKYGANKSNAHNVAQVNEKYDELEAMVARVTYDYASLPQLARHVVDLFGEAERHWRSARALYEEGRRLDELSQRELIQAAEDFKTAELHYRQATMALVALAAGSAICGTTMTTAQFRREMARRGLPIGKFEDVDHIFPRSLGGLDHPLNFQVLDRSLNRSLGNDLVAKFMQAPIGVISGAAVSALGLLGGCAN